MATFQAVAPNQTFNGTAAEVDTINYKREAGITIDVAGNGAAGTGIAAGDTYVSIERFILGAGAETFLGGAGDETVFGGAGYNTLFGGGGDDVLKGGNDGNLLNGGTGADTLEGGHGDDTFEIAAGDAEAGERIVGGLGTDTIELIGGGAGASFDLSGVNYFAIDAINFQVDGTLIVADNADQAITHGTAGNLAENVFVNSWIGGDSSLAAIIDDIAVYLGNGVDTVSWSEDTGDVSATNDPISGGYAVTYVNNGATAADWTTLTAIVDATGAMSRAFLEMDDMSLVSQEFDTSAGVGNEVLTSEFRSDLFDMDPVYEDRFFNYALDGVADGIIDYALEFLDTGALVETLYDSGSEVLRTTTLPDGVTETITTDLPSGDSVIEWHGTDGEDQITGDSDNEVFYAGLGADILDGQGGDDTFVLSETEIDGTWGALFTYADQAETSSGLRPSAPLLGRAQLADVIHGGMGYDEIQGSAGDDAVLLYSDITPINATLTSTDARVSGIDKFVMGEGNDVVDLTSAVGLAEYSVDVRIEGGDGVDYLFAGAGNDVLIGGDGADRLVGWKGDDVLTGGDGLTDDGDGDRFLFAAKVGGGTDTITDFEQGIDTMWILGYGESNYANMLSSGAMTITDDGVDSTVSLTDGTTTTDILVEDVVGLVAGDFFILA